MTLLSKLAAPLVWLLDTSGRLVLKLLGQSGKTSDGVTDEEIKSVLAEAHSAGVIETGESRMIAGVMRLADRTARGLMTPRMDVEMVDIDDSFDEIREQLQNTSRSRLPVRGEDSDEVIGVLQVRDFFNQLSSKGSVNLRDIVRDVPVVSDFSDALDVVEAIRGTPTHMVLVYDEYGHFEGVITAGDVIEAIIGAMQEEDHVEEKAIVRRADGSYLVSGWMPIDEFSEFLRFPIDDDAEYNTVAGLALEEMKHLPDVGETFVKHGWVFEIVDLDGRRIDKLLLTAEEQPTE
jgi:putative hemolysin